MGGLERTTWAIITLVLFLAALDCRATELELTLRSFHPFDDTFTCRGDSREYSEENPGLVLRHGSLLVGRYRNSLYGCGDVDYSNLLGFEHDLGQVALFGEPLYFSTSGGIVDGYLDEGKAYGEYRAFASVNASWYWVKLRYGYRTGALSLVYRF